MMKKRKILQGCDARVFSANVRAISTAFLAGCTIIGIPQQAEAADTTRVETDRIIVTEANQTITGDYQNQKWTSSQGEWWNEWNVLGGVIQNKSEGLTIEDANFDNNALYTHGDGADYMAAQGGVLNNTAGATIDAIKNSTFTNNLVRGLEPGAPTAANLTARGGAIYNSGTISVIDNVTFSGNKSENIGYEGIYNVNGGAIYTEGKIGKITNSTFSNNIAATNGGALTIAGASWWDSEANETKFGDAAVVDEISNTKFTDNSLNGPQHQVEQYT